MTQRDFVEDLAHSESVREKVQHKSYAHKLYAALCNTEWQHQSVMEILKDQRASVSWRTAGGIVAELRGGGEYYLDWYCSGYEGFVHPDIRADLEELGWICVSQDDAAQFPDPVPEEIWGDRTGIAAAFEYTRSIT